MTSTDIKPVAIPGHLAKVIGDPDPGTRMYRRYGRRDDFQAWWDAVCEICGEESSVSPGGVALYARVSRAGVHKRMKDGRLTGFLFHPVQGYSRWTKREILDNAGQPYIYIPGDECKQWAKLLGNMDTAEQRAEAMGDGDNDGYFLRSKGRKTTGGAR